MQSRVVVQSSNTRIYDAIRAMEDNGIGAVLVHDGKGLVGIVTDRDASLKAIGEDLDPFEYELADIMSGPVASVPSSATVAEVAQLMVERHVRRIPIVDGSAIRGIVTLDNLVLEHAVDASTLAAIVRGQLAQPTRHKPLGKLAPVRAAQPAAERPDGRRQEARRRQTYARLVRRILQITELGGAEQAEQALLVVVSGLLRRITREEAADFLAQLPGSLRQYAVANVPSGPDVSVDRDFLEQQVEHALQVGRTKAVQIVRDVGRALRESISAGEFADVMSQLPVDMRQIFSE